MTKKEYNSIRTAAYAEWAKSAEAQELLKTSYTTFRCWRITESEKIAMKTTVLDAQINTATLKDMGFTENASVKLLFTANRQTKTLTPDGWER